MGKTTAFTDDQLVSLIDGSATATYTLTGAKGDTLILAMTFQATNVEGGVTFAGSYTVAGGSGRFEGATGSGLLSGGALFTWMRPMALAHLLSLAQSRHRAI